MIKLVILLLCKLNSVIAEIHAIFDFCVIYYYSFVSYICAYVRMCIHACASCSLV